MAERGLGLVYVPRFTVRAKLAMTTILGAFTRQQRNFQILWPSGRQRSPGRFLTLSREFGPSALVPFIEEHPI
jgi:DNA-binding transcriptional LysR family regulator